MTHSTEYLTKNHSQLIAWRRHFHQHPEPSLKEFKTAEKIREILTSLDIPYDTVGETGSLGYIKGTKASGPADRKILLRADIDALEITEQTDHDFPSLNEGIMHACGHDSHTTALLAAADYLSKHTDLFAGTVLLGFQQAEEIGAGAVQFIESGLLKDVDQAFGMHVDPSHEVGVVQAIPGPTMASCDIFTIEVHGKSSHVARPNEGIDALAAGANIVTELQNIVSRLRDPLEPVVVGIGKFNAGTRYNIVANHAKIEGTLRTLSYESREKFLAKIEEIAHSVAAIFNATVEFSNYPAAAPVINNEEASLRAQKVASQLVGEDKVITQIPPTMGADDMADIMEHIPGVYIKVGTSSSEATSYGLHHEKFDLDESVLTIMGDLHIQYALDYLNDEEV